MPNGTDNCYIIYFGFLVQGVQGPGKAYKIAKRNIKPVGSRQPIAHWKWEKCSENDRDGGEEP